MKVSASYLATPTAIMSNNYSTEKHAQRNGGFISSSRTSPCWWCDLLGRGWLDREGSSTPLYHEDLVHEIVAC